MGGGPQPRPGHLGGRRDQPRDREAVRGCRRQRPGRRERPVQATRHDRGDRAVEEVREGLRRE